MIRAIPIIILCLMLSSCKTADNIPEDSLLNKVGSFELNPVEADSYWYNGSAYEYKKYKIEIDSEPLPAKILWGNKVIGTTPFVYYFTGTLDSGEAVVMKAFSVDGSYSQEAVFRSYKELPRKINFKMSRSAHNQY